MNQREASSLLASYFDSWYSALVRYTFRATGEVDRAEDMVQEVYLRLYQELRRGKSIEKPEAWMFCVLRHEIGKHLRQQKRDDSLSQSLGGMETGEFRGFDFGEQPAASSTDDVTGLLSVLTMREQEVMLLRMASLKYREIGEKLGISASTVNTLLARAIRKLHRVVKKRNGGIAGEVARRISATLQ